MNSKADLFWDQRSDLLAPDSGVLYDITGDRLPICANPTPSYFSLLTVKSQVAMERQSWHWLVGWSPSHKARSAPPHFSPEEALQFLAGIQLLLQEHLISSQVVTKWNTCVIHHGESCDLTTTQNSVLLYDHLKKEQKQTHHIHKKKREKNQTKLKNPKQTTKPVGRLLEITDFRKY